MGSADFMTRNTQRRVELACAVLDPGIRRQLAHYIEVLCRDNVKARIIGPDGTWSPVPPRADQPSVDAQAAFMEEAMRQQAEAQLPAPVEVPEKEGFWSHFLRLIRGTQGEETNG